MQSRKLETPTPQVPLAGPPYPRVMGHKMGALGGGEGRGLGRLPQEGLGVEAGRLALPCCQILSPPWTRSVCYSLSKRSLAVTGTRLAGTALCCEALAPLPRENSQ